MALEDISGYSLRRRLGSGSAGTVWLVRDLASGRHAVLKRISATAVDSPATLDRDLAVLQSIHHPHIARLIEVRHSGPDRLLFTQYVPAGTLTALLERRGDLCLGELVTLVNPLANALAVLHQAGLHHGRLNPDNIMFDADGRPVMTDAALRYLAPDCTPADDLAALATVTYQAGGSPTTFPADLFSQPAPTLARQVLSLAAPIALNLAFEQTATTQNPPTSTTEAERTPTALQATISTGPHSTPTSADTSATSPTRISAHLSAGNPRTIQPTPATPTSTETIDLASPTSPTRPPATHPPAPPTTATTASTVPPASTATSPEPLHALTVRRFPLSHRRQNPDPALPTEHRATRPQAAVPASPLPVHASAASQQPTPAPVPTAIPEERPTRAVDSVPVDPENCPPLFPSPFSPHHKSEADPPANAVTFLTPVNNAPFRPAPGRPSPSTRHRRRSARSNRRTPSRTPRRDTSRRAHRETTHRLGQILAAADRAPHARRNAYGILAMAGLAAAIVLVVALTTLGLLDAPTNPAAASPPSSTSSPSSSSSTTPTPARTSVAPPPPTPAHTTPAAPSTPNDAWLQTLRSLDKRRAHAFWTLDPTELNTVYQPGSDPWTTDRALLASYLAQKIRISNLHLQIQHVKQEPTPGPTVTLEVTDRLVSATAHTSTGDQVRLPPGPTTTRRITLAPHGKTWRITSITPP